jgi:hypothetical protein
MGHCADMSTEKHVENDPSGAEHIPALAPDKSLTLADKKLAGSTQCLNCGTELKGPFCYFCGQPDRNFMRFFPVLLRDLMEDLLDLDSRFIRTLKPLLFKPGRLTRDYMNGRRFRYAPPMRVYIFSSIVVFLLAALISSDAIPINGTENHDGIVHISTDTTDEELEALGEVLDKLPLEAQKQIEIDKILAEDDNETSDKPLFESKDFSFNDEPWDRETNPVDIKWLPDWLNKRINDEIEGSPQKAEQINENPNLIIDKVFDILPVTMFLLLPIVALIFKFWYLFAKRYYVEHLIFSLHNHSFMFVTLILILLVGLASDLFNSYGYPLAVTASEWLNVILGIWIPIYLLVSLRTVYQQNWFLTVGKFIAIGISYLSLLAMITVAVAVTSFVML